MQRDNVKIYITKLKPGHLKIEVIASLAASIGWRLIPVFAGVNCGF